jgi:hypothetical protein
MFFDEFGQLAIRYRLLKGGHCGIVTRDADMTLLKLFLSAAHDPTVLIITIVAAFAVGYAAAQWPLPTIVAVAAFSIFFAGVLTVGAKRR